MSLGDWNLAVVNKLNLIMAPDRVKKKKEIKEIGEGGIEG